MAGKHGRGQAQAWTALATLLLALTSVAGWSSECNDGVDNDGDGLIDWQYDLGCHGASDTT